MQRKKQPLCARTASISGKRSDNFGLWLAFCVLLAAIFVTSPIASASPAHETVVEWGEDNVGQTVVPASLTNAVTIAVGGFHALALLPGGTVIGWGYDANGQTNVPASVTNAIGLAATEYGSAALLSNGTVVAWGFGGDGTTNVPAGVTNAVAIAAGVDHYLALLRNGTVIGWGTNTQNQLNVPAGVTNVVAIAAGGYNSLALLPNGRIVEWGNNAFGQTNVPAGVTNVVAISAGFDDTVALLSNGTVAAWGDGTDGDTNVPPGITNAVAISAGYTHNLALLADGTVVSWGYDAFGQTNVPVNVISPSAVVAGGNNSLALLGLVPPTISCPTTSAPACASTNVSPVDISAHVRDIRGNALEVNWYVNGTLYQTNSIAASGGGVTDTNLSFQADLAGFGEFGIFASVSDGLTSAVSCVTYVDAGSPGLLTTWGDDSSGQIDIPAAVTNAVSVAAGYDHALALLSNGRVIAWGDNTYGETNVPAGVTNAVAISAGYFDSAALLANGSVVVWGFNGYFQTTVPPNVTNAVAINADNYNVQAVLGNGTLVEWGLTSGNVTNVPAGATNVVAAASDSESSLALLANGRVLAWGFDAQHETNVPASVTNAIAIAGGEFHYLALLASGNVVAWGNDTYGQTNVPAGVTNAVAISAGDFFSLALLDDGTVVAWGDPTNGDTSVTSGMTDAIAMAAGADFGVAIRGLQIALNGPASTNIQCHAAYTDPGAVAQGTCGLVFSSLNTNSTLDLTTPGNYTITYTAAEDGLHRSVSRSVQVVDTIAPVPNVGSLSAATGQCSVDLTNPPTATDVCAGLIVGATTDPTHYAAQGSFTVHWTYNDGNGNSSTQLQSVVVADTISPMVTCPSDIVVDASNGASAVVSFALPTATDNCTSNPVVVCVPPSGSTFNVGTNTVTTTATDAAGNQSQCQFNVIVRGPLQQIDEALTQIYGLLGEALSKLDSNQLARTGKTLTNAVLTASWFDVDHPALKTSSKVFGDDQQSAQALAALIKTRGNSIATNTLEGLVSELVQAGRNAALIAIHEAQNAGGRTKDIAQANALLAKGDLALAAGKPQSAIGDYHGAWQAAIKAQTL